MNKSAYAVVLMGLPLWSATASATELNVKLEIPTLSVAEYHRPYVALWLERPDQTVVGNLAIWYDVNKKDNGGAKWLKDVRQWWRKGGRDLKVPADGITGATRAPGQHTLSFSDHTAVLHDLPPGAYQVVVEAAREAGGREIVRVPFTWPQANGNAAANAQGKEELGKVAVQVQP